MSLLFNKRAPDDNNGYFPPPRSSGRGGRAPRNKAYLAHSTVWACVDLRAGLISTLPVDTFRKSAKVQKETPKPPVLVNPGGDRVDIVEWMYSTQVDLDTTGNTFGLITATDGIGKPARIDLIPREEVAVRSEGGVLSYIFGSEKFTPEQVWHERQYTSSGIPVGLSPVGYAAVTQFQREAAQDFATALFGGGVLPAGTLRYSDEKVPAKEAEAIKARFRLAVENNDIFVYGKDWEFKPAEALAAQTQFIETMGFADLEMTRFFGVPADLVDVTTEGSSITYANITQRNLQFLIMKLGPAIIRRETALSRLLARQHFVKLNSDALLRMDPETVAKSLGQQVKDRMIAPSEQRELMNREPLTSKQIAEFDVLFPKNQQPTTKTV